MSDDSAPKPSPSGKANTFARKAARFARLNQPLPPDARAIGLVASRARQLRVLIDEIQALVNRGQASKARLESLIGMLDGQMKTFRIAILSEMTRLQKRVDARAKDPSSRGEL